MKDKMVNLTFQPIASTNKQAYDVFFSFWAHLLYICNYGQYSKSFDVILETLIKCVSLFVFDSLDN